MAGKSQERSRGWSLAGEQEMLIGSDTAAPQLLPSSPETGSLIFNKPELLTFPFSFRVCVVFFQGTALISGLAVHQV